MNFVQIIVSIAILVIAIAALAVKDYIKKNLHKYGKYMARKNTTHFATNIAVAVITILAWISGFIVMNIVYDSIVAAIIFGILVATIVFCESRFSYITLKSDGKITISKEEVKSNLWQIVAATLVGWVVSIPILLGLFEHKIMLMSNNAAHDLGLQLKALEQLFPTNWLEIVVLCLSVIIIYNIPTLLKMVSKD